MESKKCPTCGGDIQCCYIAPEKVYAIVDGKIKRADNNDAFMLYPEFQLFCSNDVEHLIDDSSEEFIKWQDEFIDKIEEFMKTE